MKVFGYIWVWVKTTITLINDYDPEGHDSSMLVNYMCSFTYQV